MLLPSAMPPPPSRREAFVSTNIAVIRFVVNFKPCNELQGAGDKIIGTVVVLARKTVPIILYPAHVVGVKFTQNSH